MKITKINGKEYYETDNYICEKSVYDRFQEFVKNNPKIFENAMNELYKKETENERRKK